MQQRILGPQGLKTGAIGLGTGPISIRDDRPTVPEVVKLLSSAVDHGVTLWDTADAYCHDDSEMGYGEMLCREGLAALPANLKEKIVIATKGGTIRPGGSWGQDGSPAYLQKAIDASLQMLQIESIGLWQWHAPDSKVPFEDSIGAIAKAHAAGKIRYVGLSNVSAEQIDIAGNLVPIASVQNRYSFGHREPEKDGVLDKCRELGLAFLPYCPLDGWDGSKTLGDSPAIASIAREEDASPQQVALAWLLHKYERMIPIPGISRLATLQDSARAAEVALNTEQMSRLDAAVS